MDQTPGTSALTVRGRSYFIRKFAAVVIEGPDTGKRVESTGDELTIGAERGVNLQLADPAVSRHHCAIRATSRGLEVRDLGSTNGTSIVTGSPVVCEIVRAYVSGGAALRLGASVVRLEILPDEIEVPLADAHELGALRGSSPPMQRLYTILRRVATSDATVLLRGETGTGKELAAEALHRGGARANGPFVVVNCGALPAQLVESELFGHVRGAFTGADAARIGAFEAADKGTIFLDEIGELPLAIQPVLLRVLESRMVRPIGGEADRAVDVRVIAATHRDLREAVNQRRFRADLYYRLDVVPIDLPPLRDRIDDIPALVEAFWRDFRDDHPPEQLVQSFLRRAWPGNVRELRNAVERAAVVGWTELAADRRSYGDEKEHVIATWERAYVASLIASHGGNLSAAARDARMGRSYLRRLGVRYGVIVDDPDTRHDDD